MFSILRLVCPSFIEPLKQDDQISSPAVIIGPIVAVVVLVAVVAAILFYRRHERYRVYLRLSKKSLKQVLTV